MDNERKDYAFSCDDYLALPRAPDVWLIDKLVPVGGAVNLLGESKVGKSFAALQLASALSGASPDWLGFKVGKPSRVLYIQLDTPRSLWAERIERIKKTVNMDNVMFADRETLDTWPFRIENPEHMSKLRETIDRFQPGVVFIDTLRDCHGKNENDSTDMAVVTSSLVAATKPSALILVSHTRKPSFERGPDSIITAGRGSNAVAGSMDALVQFSKKSLAYIGRAIEENKVAIRRRNDGLWELGQSEWDEQLQQVIDDHSLTSELSKAKELSHTSGKKIEACRTAIRRKLKELREGDG